MSYPNQQQYGGYGYPPQYPPQQQYPQYPPQYPQYPPQQQQQYPPQQQWNGPPQPPPRPVSSHHPGYGAPHGSPPAPHQNYAPPNHHLAPNQHQPPQPPRPHSSSFSHGQRPNSRQPPPPPQGGISFGNGAPSNYRFQYSNCSGRRKALLVGINYIGQKNALRGCINDVACVSTFLNEVYGYRREDMVILTDDQQNPMSIPTKANIERAMRWLVKDAQPHDSLFFHFSGHGGRTRDLDGDEDDGYDEVIYPVDYKSAGHIVDDDMHAIMVRPLRPGVRLTAIFDSCHSGTALDLPYVYSTQGVLKEPNLAKETAQDLFSAFVSYGQGDMRSLANTTIGLFKKISVGDSARQKTLATRTSPADVIMFSGSKDTQTSSDTVMGGTPRGAMSYAFMEALRKQPKQSYVELLNSIREVLSGRFSQKPQLSSSHPIDTDLLFVM